MRLQGACRPLSTRQWKNQGLLEAPSGGSRRLRFSFFQGCFWERRLSRDNWACSSVWLERTPDKREVGSSSLPRPTTRGRGRGLEDRARRPAGAIAQLGERLLCKQEVVGSIPSGSTSRGRGTQSTAAWSPSVLAHWCLRPGNPSIETAFAGRLATWRYDL
jgi:hypothetical protein